ncbi:MAG: hypothetical protein IIX85_05655 [Clostridia bacterium]|nr:hypothetical protein [Clostridia bacterium]
MKRTWSYHRSEGSRKRRVILIIACILCFLLGFFAAHPVFELLGLL